MSPDPPVQLQRRLGLFDATMLVMGGIVGSGIFLNPYLVARQVHDPFLMMGAWLLGGMVAMAGAFIYAELAARFRESGGQYVYLREAYHPAIAFLFGWCLLLVMQTGGMAAVAITFARYTRQVTHWPVSDSTLAVGALATLTLVNCLGVRWGSTVQNLLMVAKILVIALLVAAGLTVRPEPLRSTIPDPAGSGLWLAFGAAMGPVLFAYGGWQTASFVSGEIKDPARNLTRGLLLGVSGVIVLYMSVAYICLRVLGADGLATSDAPAFDVMRAAIGVYGGEAIAIGIAISTFGFLADGMLTAPRVYFAMASDGLFFRSVAMVHPRTAAPVAAIALQGIAACVIAMSGRYDQILNYVVSVDFLWFGLTGAAVFVFRRRSAPVTYATPGHPWTTIFFVGACWAVAGTTIYLYPQNSAIGLGIMVTGVPVYFYWRKRGTTK